MWVAECASSCYKNLPDVLEYEMNYWTESEKSCLRGNFYSPIEKTTVKDFNAVAAMIKKLSDFVKQQKISSQSNEGSTNLPNKFRAKIKNNIAAKNISAWVLCKRWTMITSVIMILA